MMRGSLGGIRYGTYTANWIYDMRMSVLDARMWLRGDVPGLGLTNGDIGLLRGGVDCDILAEDFNMIDTILIPLRYTFFFRSPTVKKTLELSVFGLEQC
jgi:hypothetical protein